MRAPSLPALLLALLLAAPAAHVLPAQDAEREAVLATVQRLFDAMRAADTAAMRTVFEPGARLVGIRRSAAGEERVQVLTADEFIAFVGRDQRRPWIERAFDPEVRISGTLASVWAEYDFHFGSTFSHCGVDAVNLLKIGGTWKIVGLADTYIREGCPRRAAPPGEP